MIKYSEEKNEIYCVLDSTIYNLDTIYKCFYWYGDSFIVEISKNNDNINIHLTKKEGCLDEILFNKLSVKIKQDLIDFKLRDIVTKETKTIRELIIAKAFSNLSDEEEETIIKSSLQK